MKKIIVFIFALLLFNQSFGQGNFATGTNIIGLGIGLGSSYGSGYTYGSQSPALHLQYECGMWDIGGPGVISLGGYLAYKSYSYDYLAYNSSWKYTLVGIRSAYHYNGIASDKFDVYGGLLLGLRFISFSNNEPHYPYDYGSTDLVLAAFIGGRYYFTSNIAGYIELGNGIGVFNIGVAFKF